HEKEKWLKSKRGYYPNGQLQSKLYVEYNGDTTSLTVYELNKDSLIIKDTWYNRFLKKWMKGKKYSYDKGMSLPSMTETRDHYKCYYKYNDELKIIERRHVDNNNQDFGTYQFSFDSTGLMIQQVEFDFFGATKYVKRVYVYEYEKNDKGQVIKQETFFVPTTDQEKEVMTNEKGEQMIIYYGFAARTRTLTDTVFLNEKGERTRKETYDREGNVQFIWTYKYEYY
ncbi:MAG: hypothetical protein KDD63_24130, partial [Bacteroidetes bacterium]|nr:hypothetical protein [Bacteroidota bacterium]